MIEVIHIYTIYDIAAYLSKKQTHGRVLEILCFYSKIFYRICFNVDLFTEGFTAGIYGPESRELNLCFKGIGYDNLSSKLFSNTNAIDTITAEFLDVVSDLFAGYTANEVFELVTGELPWIMTRRGLDTYSMREVTIDTDFALKYYEYLLFRNKQYANLAEYYSMLRNKGYAPLRIVCSEHIDYSFLPSVILGNYRILCEVSADMSTLDSDLQMLLYADVIVLSNLTLELAKMTMLQSVALSLNKQVILL